MDNKKTAEFVNNRWDSEIIPQISEYIKVPNKSPHFDPDWEKHGHMDRAVKMLEDWCKTQPLKGMTVEYLIRRTYEVKAGDTVLWHAAAGGVGLIACQWLNHLGAIVIGTVGSEAKADLARAHGCHHTILYREESVPERVREITEGAGVPVVYDSVGKDTFEGSLDCLRPRGLMASFGNASGPVPPFPPAQPRIDGLSP